MAEQKKIELAGLKCLIIAGSAGSVGIIYDLLRIVPASFPIPIIIVIHRGRQFKSHLEELLQLKSRIRIYEASEKDKLRPGCAYLAPADFHLLVEPDGTITLDDSEPVMFCRPAIDITLMSAADVFGKSLVAIILSGANQDGAEGAHYLEHKGGRVVIQDPAEAEVSIMPSSALKKLKYPVVMDTGAIKKFIEQISHIKKSSL